MKYCEHCQKNWNDEHHDVVHTFHFDVQADQSGYWICLGSNYSLNTILLYYCGFHSNLSWCVGMLKYCTLRGKFVQMRGFYESVPEGSNLMSLFKTFKNQTIFTSSPASSAMINKTFFVQWQTFQYNRNNKIINIFYFLLTVVVVDNQSF